MRKGNAKCIQRLTASALRDMTTSGVALLRRRCSAVWPAPMGFQGGSPGCRRPLAHVRGCGCGRAGGRVRVRVRVRPPGYPPVCVGVYGKGTVP